MHDWLLDVGIHALSRISLVIGVLCMGLLAFQETQLGRN